MFDILRTMEIEDANSVVYYTIKFLENINIKLLMQINNETNIKILPASEKLARRILRKAKLTHNEGFINQSILEMGKIVDERDVFSDEILTRAKKQLENMKIMNDCSIHHTVEVRRVNRNGIRKNNAKCAKCKKRVIKNIV